MREVGVPPTGKKIEYAGAALFYFEANRISKVWVLGDMFSLMRQLGNATVNK